MIRKNLFERSALPIEVPSENRFHGQTGIPIRHLDPNVLLFLTNTPVEVSVASPACEIMDWKKIANVDLERQSLTKSSPVDDLKNPLSLGDS